jgi:hypothetical protein
MVVKRQIMSWFVVDRTKLKAWAEYAGSNMGKGALQAVGALLVYVIVLWIVVYMANHSKETTNLSAALAMKSPQFSRMFYHEQSDTDSRS